MTKGEYVSIRNRNDLSLIYKFYNEKFDKKKHKTFLSHNDFINLLSALGYDIGALLSKCIKHYDEQFGVVTIYDKSGEAICVI